MARKRPVKKKASRKKSGARSAPRAKTAKRASTKKKPVKKKAAASSLESLARRIVRVTQVPTFGPEELRALYNPDATSEEASGQVAVGYAGLERKLEGWEQMQSATKWKARNVWAGRETVCIEWDATVTLRDGRTVQLREVGVHEIKNGKIQRERFYYNPTSLAPPPQAAGGQ
jgi:ketosteroid isomerase-like protein